MAEAVKVKVYANDDDALIFWEVSAAIENCLGFAIRFVSTDPDGTRSTGHLKNRMWFEGHPSGKLGAKRSSEDWPFQRFWWTDHGTSVGDTVSYQVVPMVGSVPPFDNLVPVEEAASEWTEELTLGAPADARFAAYFNRGFVMSQFVQAELEREKLTLDDFANKLQAEDGLQGRDFLAGNLLLQLRNQLRTAHDTGGHVYAALFELEDHALTELLCALGDRAHVVLANGAVSVNDQFPTETQARVQDENAEARQKLRDRGVEVFDRFVAPKPFGHNKFFVRTDADGSPLVVWTGSTNWSPTGLCTQLNNGIVVTDGRIAQHYLDQWGHLRDANSSFPTSLRTANCTPTTFPPPDEHPDGINATVWFSPSRARVDLDALKAEVAAAQNSIVFLMFTPGQVGLLPTIMSRADEPSLYVRGVVSTIPSELEQQHQDHPSAVAHVVKGAEEPPPVRVDIIEPSGIRFPVDVDPAIRTERVEATRHQLLTAGLPVIIHSKIMVIDGLTDTPTVITGSHNFSAQASEKNDENFLIIKGDRELARAYSVHIMAAYDHYRLRARVQSGDLLLNSSPDWMSPKLDDDRPELIAWGLGPR